jgi:hypothetical protein
MSERSSSGNNIRRELVLDEGDAVAQLQLALLQALDLKDVGSHRILQSGDCDVQVSVFLLEARELFSKLVLFVFGHRPPLLTRIFWRNGYRFAIEKATI